MRRQTAQFWAYLSVLVASVLLLGTISVAYAVSIPQVTEFTDVPTAVTGDSKPEAVEHPSVDHQIALRVANYREKQRDWYTVAILLDAQEAHLAQLEAARQAAQAAKPKAQVKVQGSRTVIAPTGDAAWDCVHQHEAKNWASNTGNGFYGGLQFDYRTWLGVPADVRQNYGRADLAPPEVQLAAGRYVQSKRGWGPWPTTSRMCGLR